MNTIMGGKLGCLAKEIAEETVKDLDLDLENVESANDVFKKLFKNPSKLMDLVKNVGGKLDNKMKKGDIKESELMEEASEIMNKLKNMPGMGNLEDIFKKMGMPGMPKGGKMDWNAMNKKMEQNSKMIKMKERMNEKINKNIEKKEILEEDNKDNKDNNIEIKKRREAIKSLGLNPDGIEELIYSTGEEVKKSYKSTNKKKKKRVKK